MKRISLLAGTLLMISGVVGLCLTGAATYADTAGNGANQGMAATAAEPTPPCDTMRATPDIMAEQPARFSPLSGQVINGVRSIDVMAFQYGYFPDPIVVQAGEKVELNITTKDVEHGFSIKALGINEKIWPGKKTVVDFTASEAGDYPIVCTVYCGPGHASMRGTLRVLP